MGFSPLLPTIAAQADYSLRSAFLPIQRFWIACAGNPELELEERGGC
jgi:hypothetical protein